VPEAPDLQKTTNYSHGLRKFKTFWQTNFINRNPPYFQNVTCEDHRMCSVWISEVQDQCIEYLCERANLFPCRAAECSTSVEFNVDCVKFTCFEIPTPPASEIPIYVWALVALVISLLGVGILTLITWLFSRRRPPPGSVLLSQLLLQEQAEERGSILRDNFPRDSHQPAATAPPPPSRHDSLSSSYEETPMKTFGTFKKIFVHAGATSGGSPGEGVTKL
jgi:hypothetical protein